MANEAVNGTFIANDAVVANEALVALLANEAVPNKDPVIPPNTLKLPVALIDPDVKIDPVNINVSAFVEKLVPVPPNILTDPVTFNEPETVTD